MIGQTAIVISILLFSLGSALAEEPNITASVMQAREQVQEACNENTEFTVWVFGGVKQQGQRICLPGRPIQTSKALPETNYNAIQVEVAELQERYVKAQQLYNRSQTPTDLATLRDTELLLHKALQKKEALELQSGPIFFSRVLSKVDGFENPYGEFDQLYLYDITPQIADNKSTSKSLKRRVFDYTDMEFQWLGLKRSLQKNQYVKTTVSQEYVVFIDTPADNAWMDLLSKLLGIGTTLGALFAGGALAN